MRQQVEVIVRLTYDAGAELSAAELREQISDDINRLTDADSAARVEMCGGEIIELREEAAIYGNS